MVTISSSWRHKPMSHGHDEKFSFHDLESHFENKKVIEYLKKENMMSFKASFEIYTNIVPVINVTVTVHINEPVFFQGSNSVDVGTNSLEFQNYFHLNLHNPFNKVIILLLI